MNIQTEFTAEHTVQLTVEVTPERFDKAKKSAARNVAKKVNIPGFRKGKVPYRILIQNGLEGHIVEDAVDALSQDIYKEALEQSEIAPYGPGSFDDFKLEPVPTFSYTTPLEPTVELGDYLAVRLDYEEPVVDDEAFDAAMEAMREQQALIEESNNPVAVGNKLTIDVDAKFADDLPEADDAQNTDDSEDGEDESREMPGKGEPFIHEHDITVKLDPEKEPILPGFIDALTGANLGDDVVFELTIPEDDEDYKNVAGRKVEFTVTIKKIEIVTLPEMNDDLAARITKDDDEPLTLLQLRVRVRENLEEEAQNKATSEYSDAVIGKIVEGATIAYPEIVVNDQCEAMLKDVENYVTQYGLSMDMYLQIKNQTREQLLEEQREAAIDTVERSLAMREILRAQNMKVSEESITATIEERLETFGEHAEAAREFYSSPDMRVGVANEILSKRATDFVTALGKGEDLDKFAEDENAEEEVVAVVESDEPVAEGEAAETEEIASDEAVEEEQ